MSSSFSNEKAFDKMAINEFGFQKIETHVLKVHVNCIGCRQKVKKILRKIDGVYGVSIDPEKELVTVHGTVDSEILVQKLIRSGKHAEVCTNNVNNNKQILGKTSLVIPNLVKDMPQTYSFFDGVNHHNWAPEENAAKEQQQFLMGWNGNNGDGTFYHHHNNGGFGGYNPYLGGASNYGYGNHQDMQLLNQNMFVSGPRTTPIMPPTFPLLFHQVADHRRFNY